LAQIAELKAQAFSGARVEVNTEFDYRIRILHRGESIFYQEGNRALICEFDPYAYLIVEKSIAKWDDEELVSKEDLIRIKERLTRYFLVYQDGQAVKFV